MGENYCLETVLTDTAEDFLKIRFHSPIFFRLYFEQEI